MVVEFVGDSNFATTKEKKKNDGYNKFENGFISTKFVSNN